MQKRMNKKDWSVAIDFIVERIMQNHPDPFRFISEDDLFDSFNKLKSSKSIESDSGMFFELMKSINLLKDSHTRLRGFSEVSSSDSFPIEMAYFTDGFYITKTPESYRNLLGNRVTSLNGMSIDELLNRCMEYLPHENDTLLKNSFTNWVVEPDFLEHIGIIGSSKELVVGTSHSEKFPIKPGNHAELIGPAENRMSTITDLPMENSLNIQHLSEASSFYLQYNECDGVSKEEVVDLISKVSRLKVKNVIVDLRNNTGGSSLILDPFINFLKKEGKYKIYVAVSRHTYSAAIINALSLLDIEGSISVGEKTSGAPTKFGETRSFDIPGFEKLQIIVSTKEFIEEGYDYGQSFVPGVLVNIGIEDYMSGRDVVLERVLEFAR